MKISKVLIAVAAATLAVSVINAQQKSKIYGVDDPAARTIPDGALSSVVSQFTGSVNVAFTTKHVFRGVEKTNAAIQPSVLLEHESGAYFGAFFNVPFSHVREAEYDFNLGYSHKLNEKLTLDGGIVLYLTPGFEYQGQDLRKWTQEFYLGGTYNITSNFGSRVYFYYDARCEQITSELALGYALPLSPIHSYMPANLNFSVYIGYSSGNDVLPDANMGKVSDDYSYYGVSVEAPVRLTSRLACNIGVQYGRSHNYLLGPIGDNSSHFWAFGSLKYDF